FFYVTYEGNRRPGSQLLQFTVPTAAMGAGNLDGLPGGKAVDPQNGAPFPSNQIQATRISKVARTFLDKYYRVPNYGTGLIANYRTLISVPSRTNGYDSRLDHAIGTKQQFYARWSWKDIPYFSTNGLLPASDRDISSKNLIISHNYT